MFGRWYAIQNHQEVFMESIETYTLQFKVRLAIIGK